MWMDERELSEAMYKKCLENDQKEFWPLITDDEWCYYYCMFVKDREEVRKYITDSVWSCYYCLNIKDRPEIRKNY